MFCPICATDLSKGECKHGHAEMIEFIIRDKEVKETSHVGLSKANLFRNRIDMGN